MRSVRHIDKALPTIYCALVPKWSSSQNGFLFVKGLCLFFSIFLSVWFAYQYFLWFVVGVFWFFFYFNNVNNVSWTENMHCQDQNVT